jgi:hypothetical protein
LDERQVERSSTTRGRNDVSRRYGGRIEKGKEATMFEAMRDGGWGMYPTLVLGLVALGTALRFAFRADEKLLGFVESMGRAVLYFGLTGFVTALIATGMYVEKQRVVGADLIPTLVMGVKESANNLALAFTVLSLVHLVVAVGRRRVDARRAV